MEIEPLDIAGCFVIRPTVFRDERGFFVESWNERRWHEHGLETRFVQDNHSRSVAGTLRGLHYQRFGDGLAGQAKLVRVARGQIWDVIVDLRADSATFGRWLGRVVDDQTLEQLLIPAGCAHGFAVLSDVADVVYKVSTAWDPGLELGLAWDCPHLAIPWPVTKPNLSARDRVNPTWVDVFGVVAS